MRPSLKILTFFLLITPILARAFDRPYLEWFMTEHTPAKGQTLVIHGLNTKPLKMTSIIEELNLRGVDVLLLSLKGHNDDLAQMQSVTKLKWESQVSEAFKTLYQRKKVNNGRTSFIAHSLGAVLGITFLARYPEFKIDQMILLAPALRVKFTSRFIQALYFLPDSVLIPSKTPEEFRAQRGTSVAAYKALFETIDDFHQMDLERINVKTAVIMDKEDELVSFSGIKTLVDQLSNWALIPVSTQHSKLPKPYHHLIISPDALGEAEWNSKVKRVFDEFFYLKK